MEEINYFCSVVILNWNGSAMLREYLPSVVKYTTTPDCEIVVADNGSNDDSLSILKSFPTVKVIKLGHNYGFAEGYNRAISLIKSEYVVLLNSDVEVTEKWLSPLLNYMIAHPDVIAVQPKILSWKSKEEQKNTNGHIKFEYAGAAGGLIDSLGYPFCYGRVLDNIEEDLGQYNSPRPIFWASGACMAIKRNIYLQVGGLDPLFFAHMEEIDLCWRINSRGYKLAYVPSSTVFHLGGGSLDYSNPKKTYFNFRNNQMMLYKNLNHTSYPFIFVIRLFLDYIALLFFLLQRKNKDALAIIKARKDFWKNIPSLRKSRKLNLKLTVTSSIPTIIHRSIVWDYYVKNKKI